MLLLALLSGCATWEKHGLDLTTEPRLRLAVLPARCSVKVSDPERVEREITAMLESKLRKYPWFEVVASTMDAQAVLAVEVGGYGKIKKKWLVWLIGAGLIEGTAQGVAVAQVAGPWAAVGIAAEEIVQEALTWGGGAFLFNRIFTPVILDGKLTSVRDGKKAWSDTAFARINRKALKKLPAEQRKDKAVRLRLTAEKAAEELIENLAKAARRNIDAQASAR
ncbi:MAG: hypothetical protein HY077_14105 [Elusimicrobia bacterium]|nr:hypothetical protein [Elusimicrobiota bacterium]